MFLCAVVDDWRWCNTDILFQNFWFFKEEKNKVPIAHKITNIWVNISLKVKLLSLKTLLPGKFYRKVQNYIKKVTGPMHAPAKRSQTHLPIHERPRSFTTDSGGLQVGKKGLETYSAKIRDTIAQIDGRLMIIPVQANKKAGMSPKASFK